MKKVKPKPMTDKMKEIHALENKYGILMFGMAITHMVDVGHRNLDIPFVEESIKQIMAEAEGDNGVPVMTPEFQCGIIRCAAELTQFSIWTLFRYIKYHMEMSN